MGSILSFLTWSFQTCPGKQLKSQQDSFPVFVTHIIHVRYIYPHEWLIFMVNLGKYTIHGLFGSYKSSLLVAEVAASFPSNPTMPTATSEVRPRWTWLTTSRMTSMNTTPRAPAISPSLTVRWWVFEWKNSFRHGESEEVPPQCNTSPPQKKKIYIYIYIRPC